MYGLIGAKKIDTRIIKSIPVCVHGSLHMQMHVNVFKNINICNMTYNAHERKQERIIMYMYYLRKYRD